MNIKTMKQALMLCKHGGVTAFMWGHRGVGKSSVVRQAALENKMGFIDMRCSQMEASDIRGLPDRVEGRTAFLPPADMPKGGQKWDALMKDLGKIPGIDGKPLGEFDPTHLHEVVEALKDKNKFEEAALIVNTWRGAQSSLEQGILFLDELNRAQDDVIQAAFQLVLDREVGQYVLPPGWSIVCAGNYMEGYMVNGFTDPAFLNRFSHLILSDGDLTLEEWIDYMGSAHGAEATDVIEFCSQNVKHLDGDIKGELGFSIQPSRRAWEMVVKIKHAYDKGKYHSDTLHQVLAGLVGAEMANSFSRYSCPVRPKELVNKGVKALATKLQKLSRGQLIGLTWGVANMVKPQINKEEYGECAADFAEFICANMKDKDLAVAFATNLVAGSGNETTRSAMISNPNVAKLIGRFRKVGKTKKQFIDYLNERPHLQKALSNSAWGKGFDDDDK
jgi:hypothetical protein